MKQKCTFNGSNFSPLTPHRKLNILVFSDCWSDRIRYLKTLMSFSRRASSSGDVDGSSLSELPPAGLLCHPGLGETENRGGELRLQWNPQGDLSFCLWEVARPTHVGRLVLLFALITCAVTLQKDESVVVFNAFWMVWECRTAFRESGSVILDVHPARQDRRNSK